jgi:hypothetical protein
MFWCFTCGSWLQRLDMMLRVYKEHARHKFVWPYPIEVISRHLLWELSKITKILSLDNQYLCRDWNRALPEYESRDMPVYQLSLSYLRVVP